MKWYQRSNYQQYLDEKKRTIVEKGGPIWEKKENCQIPEN